MADEKYSFPGGVCPDCGHSPLEVRLITNEDCTWTNLKYVCPKCGSSEFLRKSKEEIGRDSNLQSWTHQVKARDGYACFICGETRNLDVHHLIPVVKQPSLQHKITNGITLCRRCHMLVHDGVPWPEKYR